MAPIKLNLCKERFNRVGLALQRLQKRSVGIDQHPGDTQGRIVVLAVL